MSGLYQLSMKNLANLRRYGQFACLSGAVAIGVIAMLYFASNHTISIKIRRGRRGKGPRMSQLNLPYRDTKNVKPLNYADFVNKKSVHDIDWSDKRILMRVDYNVLINNFGFIDDVTRIDQSLPTIRLLLSQSCGHNAAKRLAAAAAAAAASPSPHQDTNDSNGEQQQQQHQLTEMAAMYERPGPRCIVLITHVGRPANIQQLENLNITYSTEPLVRYLQFKLGADVPVEFLGDPTTEEAYQKTLRCKPGTVFLAQNLRFFREEIGKEVQNDSEIIASAESINEFCDDLSRLGDVYVFEAFGASHRAHASIIGIKCPERVMGLLTLAELQVYAWVLPLKYHTNSILQELTQGDSQREATVAADATAGTDPSSGASGDANAGAVGSTPAPNPIARILAGKSDTIFGDSPHQQAFVDLQRAIIRRYYQSISSTSSSSSSSLHSQPRSRQTNGVSTPEALFSASDSPIQPYVTPPPTDPSGEPGDIAAFTQQYATTMSNHPLFGGESARNAAHITPVYGLLPPITHENQFCIPIKPHPIVAVIGSTFHVTEKIQLLESLLDCVDVLILTGGLAFTFIAAAAPPHRSFDLGSVLLDLHALPDAKRILSLAKEKQVSIYLPTDHIVCEKIQSGLPIGIAPDPFAIPQNVIPLDIGPSSRQHISLILAKAHTILWIGTLGCYEIGEFSLGTLSLLNDMALATQRGSFTIVCGGESAVASRRFFIGTKLASDCASFVSSGGGASLTLLERRSLHGIIHLSDKDDVDQNVNDIMHQSTDVEE